MTQHKSNLSIDAWLARLGRILAQDTGSQPVISRAPLTLEANGDLLWWACADPSNLFVGVSPGDAESLEGIRSTAPPSEKKKSRGAAFSDLLNISLGSGEMVEKEPDSSTERDVYQIEFEGGKSVRLVVLQMEQARRETNIDMLMEIELPITLRFGSTTMALKDVAGLGSGSVIEFDRGINDPVEIIVNGRVIARGEAVIANGSYGVRISEISSRSERLLSSTFAPVQDGRLSAGDQIA